MSQYSSPFKGRSFLGRYAAAIKFQIQNFKVLSILYILFVIPMSYLITKNSSGNISVILLGILNIGATTFYYATFKQYIKRKKAAAINSDFIGECKQVFVKNIILSLSLYAISICASFAISIIMVISLYLLNAYIALTLLIIAVAAAAIYIIIPSIHYILSSKTVFIDRLSEGFKLQKGHIPGILGYALFSGFIYITLLFFTLVLVVTYCIVKYGDNYEPGANFTFFAMAAAQIFHCTFLLVPMLYQYAHIIAQKAAKEREESAVATTESTPEEPQTPAAAAEVNTPLPAEPTAEEATESTPPAEPETQKSDVPTRRKGAFKIEGSGFYSIELCSAKESHQITENLYILLGYTKDEAQSIVNNLPAIVAENLSMSEALDLRALLEQAGGSVNIK